MVAIKDKLYVWFDTEYSSLDLDNAVLLQVAALITDTSLRRVAPQTQDVRLTIRLPDGEVPSPWVEDHLKVLLESCRSSQAVEIAEADNRLSAYVDGVVGPPAQHERHRPVLAGNSIHADWWLARRFLPRFLTRLHYRQLDVTAFKLEWEHLNPDKKFEKEDPELVTTYFPEAKLSDSDGRHDAYYDVRASIAELAFYRKHLFGRGTE